MIETRPKKRVHIVWFHLYKILENTNIYSDKADLWQGQGLSLDEEGQEEGITEEHKETSGTMDVFSVLIMVLISQVCTYVGGY